MNRFLVLFPFLFLASCSSGSDSAGDAGITSASSCASCAAGEVCLALTNPGAPCQVPADGGACPSGSTYSSSAHCCASTAVSHYCAPLPSACGSAVSCDCAISLCDQACAPNQGGKCGDLACATCSGVSDGAVECVCNSL